jgi:hypothetical protein
MAAKSTRVTAETTRMAAESATAAALRESRAGRSRYHSQGQTQVP